MYSNLLFLITDGVTRKFPQGEVNVHSDYSNGNDYLPTCHSNEHYT